MIFDFQAWVNHHHRRQRRHVTSWLGASWRLGEMREPSRHHRRYRRRQRLRPFLLRHLSVAEPWQLEDGWVQRRQHRQNPRSQKNRRAFSRPSWRAALVVTKPVKELCLPVAAVRRSACVLRWAFWGWLPTRLPPPAP